MIDVKAFGTLKKRYGPVASWAIWNTDYSDDAPQKKYE